MTPCYRTIQPQRGLHLPYREDAVNHCPGCGRSHWWVGRTSAECAFCCTTLELPAARRGGGTVIRRR